MLLYVCPFGPSLSRALNLHLFGSALQAALSALSQIFLSLLSALSLSELSLGSLSQLFRQT